MSEYIKREDALHELSTAPFWDDVSESERGVARAKARYALNAILAADVEPVVRAKWKTHIHTLFVFGIDNETYSYECENCHCVEEKQSTRCPHCGAHMERSGSGE